VITTPFAPKARREAEVFGMGDLPLVVIPHVGAHEIPIGQLQADELQRMAENTLAEVRFILSESRSNVAAAYHGVTARLDPRRLERAR
jgi:hypothetical protein